jgi:hypothetical protein
MFRNFAVTSLAVAGLLTAAALPAEAGASTGTWRYWTPYTAHAAPPYWPHARGHMGRGDYHRGHHGYREGHHGPTYWHAPGW